MPNLGVLRFVDEDSLPVLIGRELGFDGLPRDLMERSLIAGPRSRRQANLSSSRGYATVRCSAPTSWVLPEVADVNLVALRLEILGLLGRLVPNTDAGVRDRDLSDFRHHWRAVDEEVTRAT